MKRNPPIIEKVKWIVLEEDDCVHVVPETDIHPHGHPKDGMSALLSNTDCPCKPQVDFGRKKPIIIHHSFEDTLKIERSMSLNCLRCGMDRGFIKKEKVTCSVWGKSYKKHLYK